MATIASLWVVTGCWSTPRPSGPPALLRRHHAAGEVLRICERGDGTVQVEHEGREAAYSLELRAVRDEHVVGTTPDGFEIRSDTHTGSSRMAPQPKAKAKPDEVLQTIQVGKTTGVPYTIDRRGRRIGIGAEQEAPVANAPANFNVSLVPELAPLLNLTFPERPLRRHDRLSIHERRTVPRSDAMPSKLSLDIELVVVKVTPEHVELACTGAQRESTRGNSHEARMTLDIRCRAQIARANGRTARWWFDVNGRFDATWNMAKIRSRTHYDVSIGGADPAVCVRAAEPAPP